LTKEDLIKRLRRKDRPLVLDVRPEEEYASGHVPGAVSIPIADLRRRLKELPKNKDIVAYCRGSFCAFAPEAARYLDKKGFRTYILDAGLPDWEAAGFPVEANAADSRSSKG
jgi:rhodanese-related sulfurtransferase